MSCKTLSVTMYPYKKYNSEIVKEKEYSVEEVEEPEYSYLPLEEKEYSCKFCISYRDFDLDEWILARGWWNDKGLWFPDDIFPN